MIIVRNVHRCERCERIVDAEKQEYASVGVVPLVAQNFESHTGDVRVSRFKVKELPAGDGQVALNYVLNGELASERGVCCVRHKKNV